MAQELAAKFEIPHFEVSVKIGGHDTMDTLHVVVRLLLPVIYIKYMWDLNA